MGGEYKCGECGEGAAKYKCPRCGLRTCCLPCVHKHKERTGCSGKRDRTEFVALEHFDDNRLISDYNFLEETLRVTDVAKRSMFKRVGGTRLKPALKELIYQCKQRKTRLVYMPQGMSKRRANSTHFERKRKCIFWKVEWVFDSTDVHLVDEDVDEYVCLGAVLEKHLSPQSHTPIIQHKLREYLDLPADQLKLLYKRELHEGEEVFYELNMKDTLRDQLAYKTVVEYPVIKVVLPSELHKFSILECPKPVSPNQTEQTNPDDCLEGEAEQQGKRFREEEIGDDDDDMHMFDFLEDLPGHGLDLASFDLEEGEISN